MIEHRRVANASTERPLPWKVRAALALLLLVTVGTAWIFWHGFNAHPLLLQGPVAYVSTLPVGPWP